MNFSHTLVIGGTGMLAEATRRLASRSSAMTLVARRPERLDRLEAGKVERVAVDYGQTETLLEHLEHATFRHGEFDLALTWVHSSAETSLRRVADLLAAQTDVPRLIDVQGAGAARAGREMARHRYLSTLDGLTYQRVILGFVIEAGGSRWLTDDEISEGVIDAVEAEEERSVVGVVEPWGRRP